MGRYILPEETGLWETSDLFLCCCSGRHSSSTQQGLGTMRLLIGLVLKSNGVLNVRYPSCGYNMVNSSVLAKSA